MLELASDVSANVLRFIRMPFLQNGATNLEVF